MMNPNATHQELFQLSARTDGPVFAIDLSHQKFLLTIGQHTFAFELFSNAPAFIAVEAEYEGWRISSFIVTLRHDFQLIRQELIRDPSKVERHTAFIALQQTQLSGMLMRQPNHKFDSVPNCRADEKQFCVSRQQAQRQLPHDASFGIIEAVEFVHHNGGHVVEGFFFR